MIFRISGIPEFGSQIWDSGKNLSGIFANFRVSSRERGYIVAVLNST